MVIQSHADQAGEEQVVLRNSYPQQPAKFQHLFKLLNCMSGEEKKVGREPEALSAGRKRPQVHQCAGKRTRCVGCHARRPRVSHQPRQAGAHQRGGAKVFKVQSPVSVKSRASNI